ncbi:MAG: hypothetical protein Q9181_007141 [Wetmoreana brouardii]
MVRELAMTLRDMRYYTANGPICAIRLTAGKSLRRRSRNVYTQMVILRATAVLSTLSTLTLFASSLPTLNITTETPGPSPWPHQPIICWDRRYAHHAPIYNDCEMIIKNRIATGPRPDHPAVFSRHLPVRNVPKEWIAPRNTCAVQIDVPYAHTDEASLNEVQATARAIMMRCVLGADHLGGFTTTGIRGQVRVEVNGAIAAVGAGFWKITPNHRPFTLTDPSISFPYVEHEKISTAVLFVVSLIAPAAIIFLAIMIFVPGPSVAQGTPQSKIWKRKLWEWNTGWLGLGLSLALAFFFTQGMKNLFGKPRPDLLSRCQPDYENQANYALGGFPTVLNGFYLVSPTICRQKDKGTPGPVSSTSPSSSPPNSRSQSPTSSLSPTPPTQHLPPPSAPTPKSLPILTPCQPPPSHQPKT